MNESQIKSTISEKKNYTVIKSDQRGFTNQGWLKSYHTFSFAEYYNPKRMGFHQLRVINEDRVAPEMGFPMHPHRDMEIISFIRSGQLEHRDNMGNSSVLYANQIQTMTAGSGVMHSEFNASKEEEVHFLQIWLESREKNLIPKYSEMNISEKREKTGWNLLVSGYGETETLPVESNVRIWVGNLESVPLQEPMTSHGEWWIQVLQGKVRFGDEELKEGDALSLEKENRWKIYPLRKAEVLLFGL